MPPSPPVPHVHWPRLRRGVQVICVETFHDDRVTNGRTQRIRDKRIVTWKGNP